jgi:hypothetical protein
MRVKGVEFAAVLHHVSRHLSDRPKRGAVAFNAIELRVMDQVSAGRSTLSWRVEGGPVIARAYLDYDWMAVGEASLRRQVSPHAGLYGVARADAYGIDRRLFGRANQTGGRVEIGVRLSGKGGALDLFGGYEKVVDAHQVDLLPMSWAFAGFRLVK